MTLPDPYAMIVAAMAASALNFLIMALAVRYLENTLMTLVLAVMFGFAGFGVVSLIWFLRL